MIYFFITYSILVTLFTIYAVSEIDDLQNELDIERTSRKFWFNRAKTESNLADEYSDEIDDLREDVEYYHETLHDFGYELDDDWNWVKAKTQKTTKKGKK